MNERTRDDIGKLFAIRRSIDLDWTQEEAAERAGIGIASVQNVEAGKDTVTARIYAKYAVGLGWPKDASDQLLCGVDPSDLPAVDPTASEVDSARELEVILDELRSLAGRVDELFELVEGRQDGRRPPRSPRDAE